MDLSITTKFTVATEQSIKTLLFLTQTIARQKLSSLVPEQKIESYISKNFSKQILINEVNSMNNQWLIVYNHDIPAGYARITSKGAKPAVLSQKRSIRIADFGVLPEYADTAIQQSLFDKCGVVCKSYEATWLKEYIQNPLLPFFESSGFIRQPEATEWDALPLPGVYLIKPSLQS